MKFLKLNNSILLKIKKIKKIMKLFKCLFKNE